MICDQCGTVEGWRSDVVPKFAWRLYRDGLVTRRSAGDWIPPGYGVAYREFDRDVIVLMPVPLNVIVAAWRAVRWRLMVPPWLNDEDRWHRMRYRSYVEGWNDGQRGIAHRYPS